MVRKIKKENSLAYKFPKLVKEWHPSKNGPLNPGDISFSSSIIAWWVCLKCNEVYDMLPTSRTGAQKQSCPFCSGKRVGKYNNLEAMYPEIAKHWHPTKNEEILASDDLPGSHKEFWWLCDKGHEEYKSVTEKSTSKKSKFKGCAYCSGRYVFYC